MLTAIRFLLALAGVALLGACGGSPSVVEPVGPRAARIADLWWLSFWLALAVFGLVVGLLLAALFRGGRSVADDERRRRGELEGGFLGGRSLPLAGGVLLPVVVLVPLSVYTLLTMRAEAAPPTEPVLEVEVVGYRYWWEVRYPGQGFVSANEIHVPTGRAVRLVLKSADVIHSFWVPRVMGKLDLTPGDVNTTWLQVDQPGVYWGECAEYCGLQHANMAFVLVAEPPDRWAAWLERERSPAPQPTDPTLLRGAQAFARHGCIACHQIRYGSGPIGGAAGPDLTHVGSRRTLAAGKLDNTPGNLAAWIADPQAIKPGNLMPALPLDSDSLAALAAYLESLK